MANGRMAHEWHQTSLIAAILAESNRDPKARSKPFTQNDFLPPEFRVKVVREKPLKADITVLKAFVK